ncbi:MAG: hypothetical protein A2W23_06405 [Planctomycetes bacterium RBG_16_43_13]|nr:MAG: hypothetical protein A2W23_06405 [Planctomycetes bacterium RBG_16_43_13]
MANFIEALGRSQAVTSAISGMQGIQQNELAIQNTKMQQAVNEHAYKKMQEEEAAANRLIPVDPILNQLTPSVKKFWQETGQPYFQKGASGGNYVRAKDMKTIREMMQDETFNIQSDKLFMEDLTAQEQEIQGKIKQMSQPDAEGKAPKVDEKTAQALQQQLVDIQKKKVAVDQSLDVFGRRIKERNIAQENSDLLKSGYLPSGIEAYRKSGNISDLGTPDGKINKPIIAKDASGQSYVVDMKGITDILEINRMPSNTQSPLFVTDSETGENTLLPQAIESIPEELRKQIEQYIVPFGRKKHEDRKTIQAQIGEDTVALIESEPNSGKYEVMKVGDQEVRGPKKAGVEVNVGDKQETEESKTVGKYYGEQYSKLQEASLSAQKNINQMNQLSTYLDNVNTGKMKPITAAIAGYARVFGIEIDKNLPYAEAARALTNQLALELRNPSGGAGMPGALSDKDREFLVQATANISNTPQSNKLIISARKKMAQRDIEIARMARDYRTKHGSIDEGFLTELENKYKDTNMFNIPKGAVLIPDKATKDGLPVYKLPDSRLWTPD